MKRTPIKIRHKFGVYCTQEQTVVAEGTGAQIKKAIAGYHERGYHCCVAVEFVPVEFK